MIKKGYKKICRHLISNLTEKEKEVILRRYGLEGRKKETLQSIGNDFGLTRERIRQIEKRALGKIKLKLEEYRNLFDSFLSYLKRFGGARKQEKVLEELGGEEKNELGFLLSLDGRILKVKENDNFYSFLATDQKIVKKVKEILEAVVERLEKEKRLMSLKEIAEGVKVKEEILEKLLEISKRISKNKKGYYGLKEWPEITPRKIADKAYLVFKELQKPLHFTEVSRMIEGASLRSVHNELIKDERFVLVGRGIYALKEWGYFPGEVKDVIYKFLKEEGPLTKEEILERIKKQRIVKENTVLVNLTKYFEKDENGKYRIKTAQI